MGSNFKKILNAVLLVLIVAAVIGGVVMCSKRCAGNSDGGRNDSLDGGRADYSDYTKIISVDDLKVIGENGKYVLDADIDLSGEEWTPIAEFGGTIEGQGHEIRNMTIISSDAGNIGFVGTLKGTICNLTFSNVNIDVSTRDANVGGVVGSLNKGKLDNVHVCGSVKASRSASCGGLIGNIDSGSVLKSVAENIEIVGKTNVGGKYGKAKGMSFEEYSANGVIVRGESNVGGIAGYVEYAKDMADLKNTGDISGESCVGGIFGYLHFTGERTFSSFTNNGNVTGRGDNVGGIIGKVATSSYVTAGTSMNDFNNFGNVTGGAYTGGLFGYFYAYSPSTLKNSKNNSVVSGKYNVGGISGYASGLAVKKCTNEGSEITAGGYKFENNEKFAFLGGYIGSGKTISIIDCANSVNLSASSEASYVGGIAGYVEYAKDMSDLRNDGDVSGESCVGGIFGYLHFTGERVFSLFTNNGNVLGEGERVGGIIGRVNTNNYVTAEVAIDDLNNFGNIAGGAYTGGLFGYFYTYDPSTLKNSRSKAVVSGVFNVGGISGYASNLSVEKCSNEGSEIAANGYNFENNEKCAYLGGYVGSGENLSFANCTNSVNLNAVSEASYVGGIAGYVEYAKDMSDLRNDGDVSGESCVGGIFGYLHFTGERVFSLFTNNGNVLGEGERVGGIIGRVNTNNYVTAEVAIDDLNNFGNIAGGAYTGGLFGYFYTYDPSTLKNSRSKAVVSGVFNVGGISGYASNLSVEKCSNEGSEIAANGYNFENNEKCAYLGGYVGSGENLSFVNCTNSVNLSVVDENYYVGGIAGAVKRIKKMSSLKNTGDIKGGSRIGGIFGFLSCSNEITLTSFSNGGSISAAGRYVGGIVGIVYADANVTLRLEMTDFNNSGDITGGDWYVGGLFGYFYTKYTSHLYSYSTSGNVCGYSKNLEIVG